MDVRTARDHRAVLTSTAYLFNRRLVRQCECNTESEDRVVDKICASSKIQSGTQNQRRRQLEASAHTKQQVAVGIRGGVTVYLGRRPCVTERSRAERQKTHALAERYCGADRSAEGSCLRVEV